MAGRHEKPRLSFSTAYDRVDKGSGVAAVAWFSTASSYVLSIKIEPWQRFCRQLCDGKAALLFKTLRQILSEHKCVSIGIVKCCCLDHALDNIRFAIKFHLGLFQFLT